MKKPLWKFSDTQGGFVSENADELNSLYLPLCNHHPLMASVSPDLHGDIKRDFNSFLLEPISRDGLNTSKISRNFWIYINPKKIWSAVGNSKDIATIKKDKFRLEAGLLYQSIIRSNKKIGLGAKTTSFIPSSGEPVEIMLVEITNISSKTVKFTPTAAIPLYARSANNLHDHRHVTSLLSRIKLEKTGVIITPTLLFNEAGHKKNVASYFTFGIEEKSAYPEYIYPTQEEFTGESGDLEAPQSIYDNLKPDKKINPQGKEPMAGLRFKTKLLKPKENFSYIILMGISDNQEEIYSILEKFNTLSKVTTALDKTKNYWNKISYENSLTSGDRDFDGWLRWVSIQPVLRKIFGCSFLPDFDYGKGGRGWRDLWQDCLALILHSPQHAKGLLIDNFRGVRIDGSNATIIGARPGEFIADRNNISRVWMDHGIWPLVTTLLYLHQTQDLGIFFEETTYFKDSQLCRGLKKDLDWKPEYGKELKDVNGGIYHGSILEHILLQNLVQFFNVGPHNHIRLEGADWNDGLDMAGEFGESVAFSSFYCQNLKSICEILENSKEKNIPLLKEIAILLDSLGTNPLDYSNIQAKKKLLEDYFNSVKSEVSGEKISLPAADLIKDLKTKTAWMSEQIKKNEWLKEGFFNGYYDNNKQRVEGKINGVMRMTLTGQVFPILSGIATKEQIKTLFANAKKNLQDHKLKGFRLNTDFKEEQPALGRAFSFVYGEKENGAFFNHMSVMFAYALYKQGFVKQGYEVLNSIYRMAVDSKVSKIYPCLPEYFNAQGRGMYSYLTGSASWFMLTLITQVFGIRGEFGDLLIEPKLTKEQFGKNTSLSLNTNFAQKAIQVKFINQQKKEYGKYRLAKVALNGKTLSENSRAPSFLLNRLDFLKEAVLPVNLIEVTLN